MKTRTDWKRQRYMQEVKRLLGEMGARTYNIDWDTATYMYLWGKTAEEAACSIAKDQAEESK